MGVGYLEYSGAVADYGFRAASQLLVIPTVGASGAVFGGCIHTSQGLEFDYTGVIIGNDMRFENGKVITDYTKRAKTDNSLKGIKTLAKKDKEKADQVADEIIKNTYRTLMTRGMKGCYVYCTDAALAQYFKKLLKQK